MMPVIVGGRLYSAYPMCKETFQHVGHPLLKLVMQRQLGGCSLYGSLFTSFCKPILQPHQSRTFKIIPHLTSVNNPYTRTTIHEISLRTHHTRDKIDVSNTQHVVSYIRNNTEISRNHGTPELQLHLVTDQCILWRAREDEMLVPDPFWAFYWPGGQVLTRLLLDVPGLVEGKTVLDVGSGCGASAIAAALGGARHVTANDICPVSAEAIKMNAKLNRTNLHIDTRNLIGESSGQWDVILLGDIFYDEYFTRLVAGWLPLISRRANVVLIGDPGRVSFLNHPIIADLSQLAEYELHDQCKCENSGLTHGHVWIYHNK